MVHVDHPPWFDRLMQSSLLFSACFLGLFGWVPGSANSAVAGSEDRPNIILILADDLGYSDLGCFGGEIRTPVLDRLAANGLRMSQFYNTAKCHSSRVCLLTGKYCGQAGNEPMQRAVTIAEAMRSHGYFTLMAGKWHLAEEPTDRGFDRYFGHLSGATNFFTGDDTFRLNGEPWSDFSEDFYTTDANTEYAIRFIDEALASERPFFGYLAFNAPHYPLQAPQEVVESYRGHYSAGWDELREQRFRRQTEMGLLPPETTLSPRPDYIPAWTDLTAAEREWEERRMEVFAAMVDRLDSNIGRLISHLEKKDCLENTLIVFCSDNGACPFERTRGRTKAPWDPESYWCYDVGWAHMGNTPFRWYKQNQHEGGISSPMIVHWPHGLATKPGTIVGQSVAHLVDLMPTCLELAAPGEPYPVVNGDAVSGQSLLPVFAGNPLNRVSPLYFQFSNNRALRDGNWKLVSARGGVWELYNMATDRTELNNLASQYPDRTAAMSAEWFRMAETIDRLPQRQRKPVTDKQQTFPKNARTLRQAIDGESSVR